MEEKRGKIQSIIEYRDKWKGLRNQRAAAVAAVVIFVLAAALGISAFVKYRTYSSYRTLHMDLEEDTVSSGYVKLGENILRYGINGVSLTDPRGNERWNSAWSMENPEVQVTEETAAVYEKNGTSLRTFDTEGGKGEITAPYPIRKAKASRQGAAAAILEDGDNTWIKYYDTDGTEIASLRTRIDSPGYPMDLALSPDGMNLAVAYVYAENGQIRSQVAFYNFGSSGKEKKDHLIQVLNYDDQLITQIDYVQEDVCVAYTEDGFLTFRGTAHPEETAAVREDQEILSMDKNDSFVVMTEKNQDDLNPYTLRLYSIEGKELFDKAFSFPFEQLSLEENQILLWNRGEFAVYSFDGVEKFRGKPEEGEVRSILGMGKQEYLCVLDQGLIYIKLK